VIGPCLNCISLFTMFLRAASVCLDKSNLTSSHAVFFDRFLDATISSAGHRQLFSLLIRALNGPIYNNYGPRVSYSMPLPSHSPINRSIALMHTSLQRFFPPSPRQRLIDEYRKQLPTRCFVRMIATNLHNFIVTVIMRPQIKR
jgi:hypothetical protein